MVCWRLKEDIYYDEIQMTSITVSFVKMSKDLRIANIYFMPLGGGEFKDKLLENLNKDKYLLRDKCLDWDLNPYHFNTPILNDTFRTQVY